MEDEVANNHGEGGPEHAAKEDGGAGVCLIEEDVAHLLNEQDEFVLGLMEDEVANNHGEGGPEHAAKEDGGAGVCLIEEDVAHERDVRIHGIGIDDALHQRRHALDHRDVPEQRGRVRPSGDYNAPQVDDVAEEHGKCGQREAALHQRRHALDHRDVPEQRGRVRPSGDYNAPQVDDVAEEHGKCGQREAHTHAEQHEEDKDSGKPQEVPRGGDVEPEHDDGDGDQREGKVDEAEQNLLDRKDEAMDLYLFEKGRGADDRRERRAGRVVHEAEGDVAKDEVQRVIDDVRAAQTHKEGAEDRGHHDHHEQGVQHAPQDAQEAAAIF